MNEPYIGVLAAVGTPDNKPAEAAEIKTQETPKPVEDKLKRKRKGEPE